MMPTIGFAAQLLLGFCREAELLQDPSLAYLYESRQDPKLSSRYSRM